MVAGDGIFSAEAASRSQVPALEGRQWGSSVLGRAGESKTRPDQTTCRTNRVPTGIGYEYLTCTRSEGSKGQGSRCIVGTTYIQVVLATRPLPEPKVRCPRMRYDCRATHTHGCHPGPGLELLSLLLTFHLFFFFFPCPHFQVRATIQYKYIHPRAAALVQTFFFFFFSPPLSRCPVFASLCGFAAW